MISWLGPFALAVGLSSSVGSAALWSRAATGGDTRRVARWAVWLMLGGAGVAVALLEWALLTHDFSVAFVAENGRLGTPVYYTVTSLWAAHNGSLLLWLLILTGFVTFVAVRPPRHARDLHPWAVAVLSVVTAFFFGLTLFTSNAFDTVVPAPTNGPGPNALLASHPAMGVHPPLLYTGYVGLSVPFAFAVAGLISGDVGSRWLSVVRTYTLVAWTALTAGIVIGAWWSYAVLGWGGYWAWDPVENASLMPWLVATALLHSSMLQRRRGALPAWNVALAVTAFLLACLGAFLTRSGVVVSVHAFARSAVGPVLLGFLVALAAAVVGLILLRADRLSTPRSTGAPLSRGTALLLNNLLLGCLTVTILLGTLFPLLVQAVNGSTVSVGPPYYNRMAVPIALATVLLMTVGPFLRWRGDQPVRVLRVVAVPAVVGAVVLLALAASGVHDVLALLTFGLAAMSATSIVADCVAGVRQVGRADGCGWGSAVARWAVRRRRRNSGMLAHLGVAVLVVGVAASSVYTVASERQLHVGDRMTVDGVQARLDHVDRSRTGDAMSTAAHLTVDGAGRDGVRLAPALRFFPGQQMTVPKPAISSSPVGDVYLTLTAVAADSRKATIRLAVNPLVGWIWTGGALMALGGLLALWPRRRREREGERTAPVPAGVALPADDAREAVSP